MSYLPGNVFTVIDQWFNKKYLSAWALFLILLFGFLLRVNHINQPYVDVTGWRECSVGMMAENFYSSDPNILYPQVNWSGPGPSYNGREFQTVSYLAALCYRVVGVKDWVGRLIPLVFGVWGIFALYQLVKRTWSEPEALAAASIMAILPASVVFERSFLPDPVMVSLMTTCIWMLTAFLQTDNRRYLYLAGILGALGVLTKITGLLTGIAMVYLLIVSLQAKKELTFKKLVPIIFLGISLLAIIAAYYLWARYLSVHYPPYHFAGGENWVWNYGLRLWLVEGISLPKLGFLYEKWLWGIAVSVVFAIGLIAPLWKTFRAALPFNTEAVRAPQLFHYWFLGCIIFYLIGAKELADNPWNFHIFSPMICAFSGRGMVILSRWKARHQWVPAFRAILVFAVLVYCGRPLIQKMQYPIHQDDFEMGMALKKAKHPDDLVITIGSEIGSPVAIYYSGQHGWVFPPAENNDYGLFPQSDSIAIQMFKTLHRKNAKWFAMVSAQFRTINDNYPGFAAYLKSSSEMAFRTDKYIIFRLNPFKL